MKELGIKIKTLREFHRYKQEYVASILGISQSGYSKIENGETSKISLLHLQKIAELYKLTIEQLFGWDGKININTVNGVGFNILENELNKICDDRLARIEKTLEKLVKELSTQS